MHRFALEDRRESQAVVGRLPNAAGRGCEVVDPRVRLHHGDVDEATAHVRRPDLAEAQGVEVGGLELTGDVDRCDRDRRERHEERSEGTHRYSSWMNRTTKMRRLRRPRNAWTGGANAIGSFCTGTAVGFPLRVVGRTTIPHGGSCALL